MLGRLYILLLLSLSIWSCSSAPTVRFERAGLHLRPKRPADCRFELYLKDPTFDYDKLGVIWFPYSDERKARPRTPDKVAELARPFVCENGGNALLLWRPSSDGYFIKATIVHIYYDYEYQYDEKYKKYEDKQ